MPRITEKDVQDLTGKRRKWRFHDEPHLPRECVGTVVRHLNPGHPTPDWVEVEFLVGGVKQLFSMRGNESVDV